MNLSKCKKADLVAILTVLHEAEEGYSIPPEAKIEDLLNLINQSPARFIKFAYDLVLSPSQGKQVETQAKALLPAYNKCLLKK